MFYFACISFIPFSMREGCTSVGFLPNGCPCAVGASLPSLSEFSLARMIGQKQLARFVSEIGGHEGLRKLVDVRCEEDGDAWRRGAGLRGGILSSSVEYRRSRFGANRLPRLRDKSIGTLIRECVEGDRILQLLVGAAMLSILLGPLTSCHHEVSTGMSPGWVDGIAILLSVVVVVSVGALNDYNKQKRFSHVLSQEDKTRQPVVVWRYDGESEGAAAGKLCLTAKEVPNEELVVGDVVQISPGMELSFDAVLFDGGQVVCDECSVTGESDEIVKSLEADPFLISGSSVLEASSEVVAVVCAVGIQSFSGEITMSVRDTEKKLTPLQEHLSTMAGYIGKFGFAAAVLTFVVLFVKEVYGIAALGRPFILAKILENLTTSIAIVVMAVPEGLPLSVTISLAYSVLHMLRDGNLVRHLAACEAMGSATVLCTDKTGTLTSPHMSLSRVYFEDKIYTAAGNANCGSRGRVDEGAQVDCGSRLSVVASSQITAGLFLDCVVSNVLDPLRGRPVNRTAEALLHLCSHLYVLGGDGLSLPFTYDIGELRRKMRDRSRYARFPFTSARRRSTTILRLSTGELRQYVVGAPEAVLCDCRNVLTASGRLVEISDGWRLFFDGVLRVFADDGLRNLCCAFGVVHSMEGSVVSPELPTTPLIFLGAVALEEKIRPEVPAAIIASIRAGIRVIMVTGDGIFTAINVARRCGMLNAVVENFCDSLAQLSSNALIDNGYAVDGSVFRGCTDTVLLLKYIPRLYILARAAPLDKKRVLQLLKVYDAHAVIAVTGDGANDAPALKLSDVGFAMNSGSEVAKRASDIILLQDSFTGMVRATMWGRNVRDNVRKFLQFQLTVNFAACLFAITGALINENSASPLKPVQLLWINLIMDTLASLALATELPSEERLFKRPPESRSASILLPSMLFHVVVQGSYQFIVQVYVLLAGHWLFGISRNNNTERRNQPPIDYLCPKHLCLVFNVFVLMQVMNFFNARLLHEEEGFFAGWGRSSLLLPIVTLIAVLQVCIVHYGGVFMGTVPLSMCEWFFCALCASGSLVVGAISRAFWWWVKNRRTRNISSRGLYRLLLLSLPHRLGVYLLTKREGAREKQSGLKTFVGVRRGRDYNGVCV